MRMKALELLAFGALCALQILETEQTIPISMLMKLRNVTSNEQFIMEFVRRRHQEGSSPPGIDVPGEVPPGAQGGRPDVEQLPGEDLIFTEQGSDIPDPIGAEVMAGMLTQADSCTPKMTSVTLPMDNDPNLVLWPMCVTMEQCGGCCGNELLECAPSVTQMESVEVMRARYPYTGADYFEFDGMIQVEVQKHLRCECRCKVQPYHCDPRTQEYLPEDCRCRCRNEHQAFTCGSDKRWDEHQCACVCRYVTNCLDDEFFSAEMCRCQRRSSNVIPEDPIVDLPTDGASDVCADTRCRTGFEPMPVGDTCRCVVASHGNLEGRLRPGQPTPRVPLPPIEHQPQDYERVPGHPQQHPVTTPRPPRRRPPARGRRQSRNQRRRQ